MHSPSRDLWYHLVVSKMTSRSNTVNFTTRIPEGLAEQARELAKSRSISLNGLIQEVLKKEIAARRREIALEGYAEFAEENAREAEEGMDDWIEIVESDGGY